MQGLQERTLWSCLPREIDLQTSEWFLMILFSSLPCYSPIYNYQIISYVRQERNIFFSWKELKYYKHYIRFKKEFLSASFTSKDSLNGMLKYLAFQALKDTSKGVQDGALFSPLKRNSPLFLSPFSRHLFWIEFSFKTREISFMDFFFCKISKL